MFPFFPSRGRLVVIAGGLLLLGAAIAAGTNAEAQADSSPPVANVDGKAITTDELDASLGASLSKLEQDLYNLKKERLDTMIGERLLADEAARRTIDVKMLVAEEVAAKITPVTEAEVNDFYETNKARLPSSTDIKTQIRQYLSNQRTQARMQEYLTELRSHAKVELSLPSPPIRRTSLAIEGAPVRGNASAPVTIVEFSDFHCPFCKRVQPTLLDLLAKYPDKVRIVYKDLPIDSLHPEAKRASEAARCARDQGKFWEYHDKIYAGGPDSSPEYLRKMAAQVGLDVAAFDQCLASGKHLGSIQIDLDQAGRLGLNGTPAFFINGRTLSGAQPIEAFTDLIDEELGTKSSK